MANQAGGDSHDVWRPQEHAGEVPPWGTPSQTRRYGEPGHTVEPELGPQLVHPSWPPRREASQAVLALVFGLVGLFLFPPLAPVAWIIGRREVRAVDEGRRDPRHRALGQTAVVLGVIGTVVLVLGVVLIAFLLILLFAAVTSLLQG